jgi:hypothetical protein
MLHKNRILKKINGASSKKQLSLTQKRQATKIVNLIKLSVIDFQTIKVVLVRISQIFIVVRTIYD